MSNPAVRLILSTIDSAEAADRLATTLLEERLVACVNVVQGIRSHYRWQGKLCADNETLLLIKTTADRAESARRRIVELHPYEVAEVIEVAVDDGHAAYLAWVAESVADAP